MVKTHKASSGRGCMIPGPETEIPHAIGTAKKKKKVHISISISLQNEVMVNLHYGLP